MGALFVAIAFAGFFPPSSRAHAAGSNELVASQACPAFQSIAKQSNPVPLTIGQTYRILAANKEPPTWLQVAVPGAAPSARWVQVSCGTVSGGLPASGSPSTPGPKPGPPNHTPSSADLKPGDATHVLSLSWEPTFCVGMSTKAECAVETAASPEARQLSLHGLWPQPRGYEYCIGDVQERARERDAGEHGRWQELPDPGLSDDALRKLRAVMPGVQSQLERHEWAKHGTCYGASPDVYFTRAAELVDEVNSSAVGTLFAGNLGKSLSADQILNAFVQAFGSEASTALHITCKSGGILQLDLYIAGGVTTGDALSKMMARPPPPPPPLPPNCGAGRLIQPKS